MSESKGTADLADEVLTDLRSNADIVSYLPGGEDAIYESHPTEETDEPIAVILWVVSDVSSPGRGAHEKSWRIQITIKASRPWREQQTSGGVTNMQRLMDHVHDILDRMDGYQEVAHGSEGGGDPESMDGGYLAIANDWRTTGFYADDRRPSQM